MREMVTLVGQRSRPCGVSSESSRPHHRRTYQSLLHGCEPRRMDTIRWLFWRTCIKPYMEAHLSFLVHVANVPGRRALGSALPDRTVCGFRRSNCQPSAVEVFRSQQHSSGTGFLTMSRRPNRCWLFGSNWNTLCSSSHSQTLLCDICLAI